MGRLRRGVAAGSAIVALALVFAAGAGASFQKPVYVSEGQAYQAAEPSIRVDATDPNQRIWIAAPTGIGVDSRSLPENEDTGGDLFWYSDTDGKTWQHATEPGGVGSPTIVGGGDSDV